MITILLVGWVGFLIGFLWGAWWAGGRRDQQELMVITYDALEPASEPITDAAEELWSPAKAADPASVRD